MFMLKVHSLSFCSYRYCQQYISYHAVVIDILIRPDYTAEFSLHEKIVK
jgi:hypothetical protein